MDDERKRRWWYEVMRLMGTRLMSFGSLKVAARDRAAFAGRKERGSFPRHARRVATSVAAHWLERNIMCIKH